MTRSSSYLGIATVALLSLGQASAAPIFSDDFSGPGLAPGWVVLPGSGAYSVTGGKLRYYNQGPLSSPGGWSTTSLGLAHEFSGTHWQVDTKAEFRLLWLNGSGGSSGAQRPQMMVNLNQALPLKEYVAFDRSIDAYYSTNRLIGNFIDDPADIQSPNLLVPPENLIIGNIANGDFWLRIIRAGGDYSLDYSRDGISYSTALSGTLSNATNPYNRLLITATTYETVGSYTDFDFVSIEAVPEPATFALLAAGLAGLAALRRRRAR